jgi:Ig-like domain CHU_C associated
MVGRVKIAAMTLLVMVVVASALAKVRPAHPDNIQAETLQGSITLGRNGSGGAFAFGPLATTSSTTLRSNLSVFVQSNTGQDLANNINQLIWTDSSGVAGFQLAIFPSDLNADLTPGTFCVNGSPPVSSQMFGYARVSDLTGSSCIPFGTITLSSISIKYDVTNEAWVTQMSGSFSMQCMVPTAQTQSDRLFGSFSLTGTNLPTTLSNTPSGVTSTPVIAQPSCFTPTTGGGGGTGGGTGGSGGGSGSGTPPIGAFPGFTGFGPGALGGGKTSGTPTTPTPFLSLDIGFDPGDGIPTFDNTGTLVLPLFVSSSALSTNVTLSASSDPAGLDFSFDTPTLPPENLLAIPFVTIRPENGAPPRDYLVTVTATSGDQTAQTSFLVTLTCDPPFISSLATSQPQSQTIRSGGTATLGVTAIGSGPFNYQWYQGTTGDTQFPVINATGRQLTTGPLQFSQTYWVRVTNGCGTADSNPATVNVQ